MYKKHFLVCCIATCLISPRAIAQTLPSMAATARSVMNASLGHGDDSGDTTANQKICIAATQAVIANIQSQLAKPNMVSVNLEGTTFVYSAPYGTHCVIQMILKDALGQKYPYTLNYDVSASGVNVFAAYKGAGEDPFHLYTFVEFMHGISPAQESEAVALKGKRQEIKPYLAILLDPNTSYPARIEVYSKLCDAKLVESDLILQSQAQKFLDTLVKDYINATAVSQDENGNWELRDDGHGLQATYCVMYGIFPDNAHKALSVLDASSVASLPPLEWALEEIRSEGVRANDMLPTLMKWYNQTLNKPGTDNAWTQVSEVMQFHEALVPAIMSLAGENKKSYLAQMTHDPDPNVAKDAADRLLNLTAPLPSAQTTEQNQYTSLSKQILQAVQQQAARHYPREALLSGIQGTALVSFDYLNGKVSNVQIQNSSGSKILDSAALEAVASAIYPAAPSNLTKHTFHFTVPLRYGLGGG